MRMEVEEINVTGSTTHRVELSYTPTNPTEVLVDPIGGPAQVLGTDFIVEGKYLVWDLPASDIKGVVSAGFNVVLRVVYERAT
jgi:hypothetical protein